MIRKALNSINYLLVVTLVALLLTEITLWVVCPIGVDQSYSTTFKQNLPGLKKEVVYDLNQFGFRSISMSSKKKAKDIIRIMVIGASTVDQMTHNTEDTWSGKLETMLNERFKSNPFQIEVVAWGRGGEKVFDRVRFVEKDLKKYSPDMVIALEGINDLAWHGGPDYSYDGKESRVKGKDRWYTPIKTLKHKYSQIYKRIRAKQDEVELRKNIEAGRILEYHTDGLEHRNHTYEELPYQEVVNRNPDPIVEFEDGVEHLIRSTQNLKINIALLTQPVFWKKNMSSDEKRRLWFYINTSKGPVRPGMDWAIKEMERYSNIQEQKAEEFNAIYIPLDQSIPKTIEYFIDDCHFTLKANELISTIVSDKIAPEILRIAEQRKLIFNNF